MLCNVCLYFVCIFCLFGLEEEEQKVDKEANHHRDDQGEADDLGQLLKN